MIFFHPFWTSADVVTMNYYCVEKSCEKSFVLLGRAYNFRMICIGRTFIFICSIPLIGIALYGGKSSDSLGMMSRLHLLCMMSVNLCHGFVYTSRSDAVCKLGWGTVPIAAPLYKTHGSEQCLSSIFISPLKPPLPPPSILH